MIHYSEAQMLFHLQGPTYSYLMQVKVECSCTCTGAAACQMHRWRV